jgi:hypothetical protein
MNAQCDHFHFAADDPLTNSIGLGSAAIRYAALGYAVIPLTRGGKRPHAMLGDRGGVHLASRDQQQVFTWWLRDPAANIGVATGVVNQLCVIDLDVKGGKNGPHELSDFLQLQALSLPSGPVAHTPSGGWHLWLRSADPVPERPGILPGVDVKGDGGLVAAPPSMALTVPYDRSGGTTGEVPVPYSWAAGCPHSVPGAPPWLHAWLQQARPASPDASDGSAGGQSSADLDAYMKTGVPEGQRNREIYRIACRLFRIHGTTGDGAAQVRAAVRDVYGKTDKRDFTWREVLVCIESARRFVEQAVARERIPAEAMESFTAYLERRKK